MRYFAALDRETEDGTLSGLAPDGDVAPHQFDEMFRNGETQAHSAAPFAGAPLRERQKELSPYFLFNPDAGILDVESQAGSAIYEPARFHLDIDPALLGKFNRFGFNSPKLASFLIHKV